MNHKTIVLVGMMGVGKTTVGRRLAHLSRLPFHDADIEIEQAAGMPVSDYFMRYGELEFRKGERRVIRRLLNQPPHVLATGGGSFVDDKTRSIIKSKSISVWLKADLEIIVERTSRRDTRPLLQNGNPEDVLIRLLNERTPYYNQADIHIDCEDGPHMHTAEKIFSAVSEFIQ